MIQIHARWLVTAATAISPLVCVAQESATQLDKVVITADADSPYTVPDSNSATKLSLSLRETPQSLTVITRERLDDQNLVSLRDVLDNTPGVYSYSWDSERVVFISRGFKIDSLLYDGVPAVDNFNTDSVDESLDTALYERIEVVRGATGLMTGAGSPAASINLVRKHADSKTLHAGLELTGGSWNDRRAEADISAPLTSEGTVRGRLIGVYQDKESYQDLYRNRRKVVYGIVDADLSDHTLLSVGFDYQNNLPRGNTWGSFPLFLSDGTQADWPRSVTTATDWSFWNRRKESVFGELRHTFSNDWSLRASVSWRQFNEDMALFYVFGFPDTVTGEGLEPFAYRSKAEIIERAVDLYASGPITLWGRTHELVIGYNGSKVANGAVEFSHGDLADTGNFFQWDGHYPQPEFSTDPIPITHVRTRQNGVYAAGRFVLTDPLKLIGGARYVTWKTDYFYFYDSPQTGFHYDYRKVIPYAGLIFDVSKSFSAFASYTEIFKPQNSRDATGRYLDPITGKSYEIGIKGEHFDRKLNTALTLFQTFQDNVASAVFDPDTGAPIMLPDGTQVSHAVDGTRTRGFEFELSGQLRRGWNASLGWSKYTIQDGDRLPFRTFVPGTLVRAFTTWTPSGALSKLTIGGGLNWQSASHTFVGTPDGGTQLRQRDVTLLSVTARYQITPNVSVQFNGNNLLDKKYYILDDFDDTSFGAPASYALGVNVRL